MTIQEQIKQRIDGARPGTVFFVNDFAEFDNEYVSKILSLLKDFGVLERLAKGIYYKPIITQYGNVYPSAEKIVRLIAEHENAEILPTGEYALNALGFSTQIPMKAVYLTTGSPRTINIGNKKIRLKHRAPSSYSYKSQLMPLLVLALKAKGKSNITPKDIDRIEEIVSNSAERQQIKEDLSVTPVWIRKYIKPIIEKYEHMAR
jgi:hypothetical protein